uniref:Protein FAM32A n=1 Tax=Moschus moschiferus TaxID=68415 RepID=A0A8C6D0M5_MOSMO
MEAGKQVKSGLLSLKGIAELGVTKKKKEQEKDKATLEEETGMSIKNEESSVAWDKGTLDQLAFEEMQEKWQMERILKKTSKTHKPEAEGSRGTWTHSLSTMTRPKSAGESSAPAWGMEGHGK